MTELEICTGHLTAHVVRPIPNSNVLACATLHQLFTVDLDTLQVKIFKMTSYYIRDIQVSATRIAANIDKAGLLVFDVKSLEQLYSLPTANAMCFMKDDVLAVALERERDYDSSYPVWPGYSRREKISIYGKEFDVGEGFTMEMRSVTPEILAILTTENLVVLNVVTGNRVLFMPETEKTRIDDVTNGKVTFANAWSDSIWDATSGEIVSSNQTAYQRIFPFPNGAFYLYQDYIERVYDGVVDFTSERYDDVDPVAITPDGTRLIVGDTNRLRVFSF